MEAFGPYGEPKPDKSGLNESEFYSDTPDQAAKRILKENTPFAAAAICNMALDESVSPSVRLRAAQYVVDRELGPVGSGDPSKGELEAFLEGLVSDVNLGT
jgi:hypothetical protein